MDYDQPNKSKKEAFRAYAIGFLLSCVLTLASYFSVQRAWLTGKSLVFTIIGFGLIQAWIQLIYFLHLNKESKPRLHLFVFLFMALVAIILVGGSLWIVFNLDYRTMRD